MGLNWCRNSWQRIGVGRAVLKIGFVGRGGVGKWGEWGRKVCIVVGLFSHEMRPQVDKTLTRRSFQAIPRGKRRFAL